MSLRAHPPEPIAMTAAHIPEALRLCRASGWNQVAEDWRVFLEEPGSGAVVLPGADKLLGTAAWLRYDRLAWIAMMLVDPAERRGGLGSRLLANALSVVDDAPAIGLDASAEGEPLYRRSGFEPDSRLVRVSATIEATRVPRPAGRARPMAGSDLLVILETDRALFGADRGALLARLLARAPQCAWVLDGSGAPGYLFGRPGHLYFQLGPLVAADLAGASELIAACLSAFAGRKLAIDVNPADAAWMRFLQSTGFSEERGFLRMYRRRAGPAGLPARLYAICGPEFG